MKLPMMAIIVAIIFSFCIVGCEDFTVKIEDSTIKVEFEKNVQTIQKTEVVFPNTVALEWKKFYKDNFGFEVSFDEIVIPTPSPDYWDIFIPKGLDENTALNACKRRFDVWLPEDTISKISFNKRSGKESSYFVRFQKRAEADEEYKNLSANELTMKNIDGITILERIVLELYYFDKVGSHLDIDNITLCSGSRDSSGIVPVARWLLSRGEFRVDWYFPGYAVSDLRARAVVSY